MTENRKGPQGDGRLFWWGYPLLSALLLLPCYWQSRIQAGDLGSHIYNSWLAQLIASGRAPGLRIVGQTTNVLFDLILSALFRTVGAGAAQRIAVSLAVLVFVWGAFAFASAIAGRRCWHMLPVIAMLAYGWVYHMGFFNFYLSLGLCFWALAAVWKPSPARLAAAVPLLAAAWFAHILPVAWAGGMMVYILLARRLPEDRRVYLLAGAILAILAVRAAIGFRGESSWSWRQIYYTTGIDQVWVYDSWFLPIAAGLVLLFSLLFFSALADTGWQRLLTGLPFQLCAVGAAGVLLLPEAVLLRGYEMPLDFISERLSLTVGICVCGLLGGVEPRRWERYAMPALAAIFFGLLFRDEHILNAFEDRMQTAVARLAPGQRVISPISDSESRFNFLTHMIDRVCIGRCYSYTNYEPSTGQFRVRVDAPNPIVASDSAQSRELQVGAYVVRQSDLPLYSVDVNDDGELVVRSLPAGVPNGSTAWNLFSDTAAP